MRSLERHRDVGAYALGVLDEAEAFRFEDHLMECASCKTHVNEFRPAARQLMLYRNATPRPVHPFAAPGPHLLERLLDDVTAKRRSGRSRLLYAVAAAVVFAVGGPALAIASGHGGSSVATAMSATDPDTGVWAEISTQDRIWGSQIDVTVKDTSGPHPCRLVAVGKDGSEQTVTSWMVPADGGEATTVSGGAALQARQIDHFEVRTRDGQHLVTLKSR
ncbi:zf-HC2 domain-containing protein [Streptomyces chiangmaiensis]|uniref:Zf-HC2 domain-containing protein n=1 Tax=Streptomyces chiangmaiensis TaxID=766497 RepID=A0ABU7FGY4_9ACTN|nr:zf-HC2 domain-containing protein [Streptomyces chiangmaiensis]MED7823380.1 zf-HC2 domain-containing protein [Streptomyces chiangmaiensis]